MMSEEKMQLRAKINLGLKASIAATLDEHARAGRNVTIWRDGQILEVIPPQQFPEDTSTVREYSPES